MANQSIGYGIQDYRLHLNNRETEDFSNDDDDSTASNFEVILQPTLDISNLLFLKSTEAEIGLSELTIDNTCLTFKRSEQIQCYVKIDVQQENGNKNPTDFGKGIKELGR